MAAWGRNLSTAQGPATPLWSIQVMLDTPAWCALSMRLLRRWCDVQRPTPMRCMRPVGLGIRRSTAAREPAATCLAARERMVGIVAGRSGRWCFLPPDLHPASTAAVLRQSRIAAPFVDVLSAKPSLRRPRTRCFWGASSQANRSGWPSLLMIRTAPICARANRLADCCRCSQHACRRAHQLLAPEAVTAASRFWRKRTAFGGYANGFTDHRRFLKGANRRCLKRARLDPEPMPISHGMGRCRGHHRRRLLRSRPRPYR